MCIFCSDLPSDEREGRKSFISLFLKPNDPNNPKETYRFRLLNYRLKSKNNRRHAFISRFVHNHWSENDKGQRVMDDYVVCPSSPFIDARNDMSLGFVDTFKELKLRDKKPTWDAVCPMCKHVAEAWNAWKSSGYTDKLAQDRIRSMQKQFQGVVPVYVVNDPVNPKNNGRFKCVVLSNQDEYKHLLELVDMEMAKINAAGGSYNWCNGENAVDLYIRMEKAPITYKNGSQGMTKKITKMFFGQKAYDLRDKNENPVVTKEAIDKFEFDDQYYVKSTKSELEEFYAKYYSIALSNVPDEDIDELDAASSAAQPAVKIPTNTTSPRVAGGTKFVDNELLGDPDDVDAVAIPADSDSDVQHEVKPQTIEEMFKEMDFEND